MAARTRRNSARPPRASWSGETHVLREPQEVRGRKLELPGGEARLVWGPAVDSSLSQTDQVVAGSDLQLVRQWGIADRQS